MRIFLLQLVMGLGCLWGGAGLPACDREWPGDEFAPGWRRYQTPMVFSAKDLYGYIDGGAELFFEFGFSELTVQRYRCGERELSLDLYRMTGRMPPWLSIWQKRGRNGRCPEWRTATPAATGRSRRYAGAGLFR